MPATIDCDVGLEELIRLGSLNVHIGILLTIEEQTPSDNFLQ